MEQSSQLISSCHTVISQRSNSKMWSDRTCKIVQTQMPHMNANVLLKLCNLTLNDNTTLYSVSNRGYLTVFL